MSKFLPSKVISLGIALFKKSHNKTNSTGILTILREVKCFSDKLSIKSLPFGVANKKMIVKIVGNIPINIIFGGKEFVSLLYTLLYVKTA